jgi:hypothetical protein
LITGANGARNPHPYYAFSTGDVFEGVLSGDGRWKLHLPHKYRQLVKAGNDGAAGTYRQTEIGLSLFDMEKDPFESTNVLEKHPDVAARMQAYAAEHRRAFYSAAP